VKLASLSRAMFLGFVRDRAALIFSILLPVLFLLFFGAIYKNANAPRISLITVGQVSLIRQAQAADPTGLGKIVTVTTKRSLAAALTAVRDGNDDAVLLQHDQTLVLRYSIADPTTAGIVNQVVSSIVQQANQAGRPPTYTLDASQVQNKSLKTIQYITPGLLGWALASGATFGSAITLVSWRQNKLLRRLRLAPVATGQIVSARIGISVGIGLVQMAVFLGIATLPYFGLKLHHHLADGLSQRRVPAASLRAHLGQGRLLRDAAQLPRHRHARRHGARRGAVGRVSGDRNPARVHARRYRHRGSCVPLGRCVASARGSLVTSS
jgi:ABC-2 type transport system permease protein